MLRAILIDDERDSLEALSYDLRELNLPVEILALCESAKDGLKAIKNLQPDLVFLDIEMPYMTGLEMLELVENINFEIIFITAYNKYALEAFKYSAAHYLTKPVDGEELSEAVHRVKRNKGTNEAFTKEQLDSILDQINQNKEPASFAIPTMKGYVFYPLSEIIYCQADESTTKVFTTTRKFTSGHSLKEFEHRLPEQSFCRIHHSYIVNMEHIQNYYKGKSAYLIMSDGTNLRVSEGRKQAFVNRFKW